MSVPFTHLHNHTEYSLLDGANRIPAMIGHAKGLGMDSLAITDHGVMFGVMEFFMEAKKQGIKPILGVEAYVAPKGHTKRLARGDGDNYHLLLLAKNLQGYRNLCKLSTIAALDGFYYKPRIDHELLEKYSEGLIATSTCLGSEVCQALLKEGYDAASTIVRKYVEIFGQENYFIELQDHGLSEQQQIREPLLKLAKDYNLKIIATNDAHYMRKEDALPHDVLLCIQTGAVVKDEKRMKFETEEFYLKSPQEMAELFADVPDALENTMLIASMCDVELDKQRAPMPQPDIPGGLDSKAYLRKLAEEGLQNRVTDPSEYLQRLDYELSVIEKTGYEDYFLLVREFAGATRERGINFGVRGSAAGSLVSYCVGITDVDPVAYDLTFERFLNPERVSMPDIDMDFEDARRDEIIQWVTDRYGKDHVAQIITFGTLGAKAAIRDSGRVLGFAPSELDQLCKLLPTKPDLTIQSALDDNYDFRTKVESDAQFVNLVKTAQSVEGMARHSGVHAAGVVISKEPLVDYIPLYRGTDGQAITAYEMSILEKIGMLKMDFLGLSNLTVLAKAVQLIKDTRGETLDVRNFPQGDPKTYELLARGDTVGVFQLESGGMTKNIVQLKPTDIRELAAMIALYRPGPIEHIGRFIDLKFGREKIQYLDPLMEPILKETYGVIVYQDQVLKLVQALAGFSLGKADILRRAMGKKDAKQMAAMKTEFVDGCQQNGISMEVIEKIWDLLLPFAGYAFNKAHAVCYSIVAYQTAYLKANYPIEYMAALLATYREKEDRVIAFIEECRQMKVPVLRPDINSSELDFTIEGRAIRFGLGAVKGLGDGIVHGLIEDRKKNGPFTNFFEIADRLKPFNINRTGLDALIKAGALDAIDPNRGKLLAAVEGALGWAEKENRDRLAGQDSLFFSNTPQEKKYPVLEIEVPMAPRTELLAMERESIGVYVSDHPLRGLEKILKTRSNTTCGRALEGEDRDRVVLAGVLTSIKVSQTKGGAKMARGYLEDFSGRIDLIVYPKTFDKVKDVIKRDAVISVTGFVSVNDRNNTGDGIKEIRVDDIQVIDVDMNIAPPPIAWGNEVAGVVQLTMRSATLGQLRLLEQTLKSNPGSYGIEVYVANTDLPAVTPSFTVDADAICEAVQTDLKFCKINVQRG